MTNRKPQTDIDVKRKAIKLVVTHLKKKIPESDFHGSENVLAWIEEMESLIEKDEFVFHEFILKRKELNDVIERVLDVEIRYKLRDSWISLGKAIDKKVKLC
jgi:hypothetical protein